MECSKQLAEIVKLYKPGDKILDFDASGHYYNSLKRIDDDLNYTDLIRLNLI